MLWVLIKSAFKSGYLILKYMAYTFTLICLSSALGNQYQGCMNEKKIMNVNTGSAVQIYLLNIWTDA